jgi:SDR family mycofactocin-dependent oxidoreductase
MTAADNGRRRLEGKVAFITGGARGQGRSHAVGFAREGADVVLLDACSPIESVPYPMPSEDDLAETVALVERAGARAVATVGDVRDAAAVRDAVDRGLEAFGHIDIVAANAGIVSYGPLWEITEDAWNEMLAVNVTGVWQTIRATVPHMIERGQGGSVIATSSCAGLKGFGFAGHYSAAKHAVVGMIRSLAIEIAPHAIRANVVCPFSVGTDMILNEPTYEVMTGGANPTFEGGREAFQSLNLLPIPWVDTSDVTNLFVFLASDESRYMTGIAIPVDAGFMLR